MYWYNQVRSKEKLAGLSPVEYRTQSSQSAA
ncbi:IS3 family transposase [Bacillus norwichensis]